jgi:hypothetical protein
MNRPQNWQEHRALAHRELQHKVWKLQERAAALDAFLSEFDATADDGCKAITELAMRTNVAYTEDYLVPAVQKIYQQGDSIMTAPGEGFW